MSAINKALTRRFLDEVFGNGNLAVAMRVVTRGTHRGELMGIAATGRSVAVNEQHIVRVTDGKLVEHLGVEDSLGMMQQLGVVEAP